jgi:transposase InsO family protein
MGLSRSSYYHQPRPCRDDELVQQIEPIVLAFAGYGYRRVTEHLQRQGLQVNHKRVLRVMRQQGLIHKRKKRHVTTTDSRHQLPVHPNLLPETTVTGLDQVWIADITYVRVRHGFVYLAAILDRYSRKVIGHAVELSLETTLTLTALRRALAERRPQPGVIHHSDRGSQYAAGDYVALLRQHRFRLSMSRRGNPYDNAAMESFFKTVKVEEVYLGEYEDLADVRKRLAVFLLDVYNRKRLHSSLGYRPPDEFEDLLRNKTINRQTVLT